MEKILLLTLIILGVCFSANAQKIKKDEVDKFTKNRIIETSFEDIFVGGPQGGGMHERIRIGFKKFGENNYLRIRWYSRKAPNLEDVKEITLLDSKGNTCKYINVFGENNSNEITKEDIVGIEIYAIGDFSFFKDAIITDLRIQKKDEYTDFKIKNKYYSKITKTFNVFEKAIQE